MQSSLATKILNQDLTSAHILLKIFSWSTYQSQQYSKFHIFHRHCQRKISRPTDLKWPTESHTASEWQDWNSNLDHLKEESLLDSVSLVNSAFLCALHPGFIFERHLNIPQSFEKTLPKDVRWALIKAEMHPKKIPIMLI